MKDKTRESMKRVQIQMSVLILQVQSWHTPCDKQESRPCHMTQPAVPYNVR